MSQVATAVTVAERVHACGIPVLDLDSPDAGAAIEKACFAARDADGCDAIVLGCGA